MKKFLTVLLALSVVFTYTVGSAFAADTTAEKTYTAEEVEYELNKVVSAYEKDMTGNTDRVVDEIATDNEEYTVEVKEKAIETAATEFIKELVDDMDEIVEEEVAEADKTGTYDKDDLADAKKEITSIVIGIGAYDAYTDYEPIAKDTLTYGDKLDGLYLFNGTTNTWEPASGSFDGGTARYFTIKKCDPQPTGSIIAGQYAVPSKDTPGQFVKNTETEVSADATYYNFVQQTLKVGSSVSDYFVKNGEKYETPAETYAQEGKTYYKEVTKEGFSGLDYTDYKDFSDALKASGLIEKAEAPLAEVYYTEQVEEDYPLSNYPADGKYEYGDVENLTGQEAVDAIKADALKVISEEAKALKEIKKPLTEDYNNAIKEYKDAYDGIAKAIDAADIPTNEDLEDDEMDLDAAIQLEIAKLKTYAVGTFTDYIWGNDFKAPTGTETIDLSTITNLNDFDSDIYDKDAGSKSATIFGVDVKDVTKATRAEVLAVKAAYNNAILETVDAVEAAVKASDVKAEDLKEEMKKYYKDGEDTTFVSTVNKAYGVADKHAAVIARGDALKAAVKAGEKLYDDAKVDSVVKVAAEAVYADMGAKSVEAYFVDAINEVFETNFVYGSEDNGYTAALTELLLPGDFEYDKLMAAVKEAAEKFKDKVITIGSDATPEADKKYCKNYYAVNEKNAEGDTYGDLYDDIAATAKEALAEAQSYADIDAAMAAADAELAKLMLAADAKTVTAARDAYCAALEDYSDEMQDIKGTADYDVDTYAAAVEAGKKLINDAVTVDGVKAAYEDAKDLFDTLKTDDELEALNEEIEKTLKALPLASKVTAADAEAIEAAREAYDAYEETIGVEKVSTTALNRLKNAERALYTLEAKALTAEVKALSDKLNKIDFASEDIAVAELLALKDEMTALSNKVEAFNQKMEDKGFDDIEVEADAIVDALDLANGSVWYAEVYMTEAAILKVLKSDAINMTDVNAAFDAYKALTDKQQYLVDKETNYAIETIKGKLINATESLKIKTSTKLYTKSNKIRVNWKVVDGDAAAIDGYYVYKSTKAQTGYKYMGKTTKNYMDNKKNLKKGKRYFYKVKAYVEIDGVKYFSDDSNKGNRIYK